MIQKCHRNDPCPCNSGKKFKNCCGKIPEVNPLSIAGRLLDIYRKTDSLIKELQGFPDGPICSVGCSDCCKQLFLINPIEYALIQRYFTLLQNDILKEITERSIEIVRKLESILPEATQIHRSNDIKQIIDIRDSLNDKLTRMNNEYGFQCPLLNLSTNTCYIYEGRPWACRAYGTTAIEDHKGNWHVHSCEKTSTCFRAKIPYSLTPDKALKCFSVGRVIPYWVFEKHQESKDLRIIDNESYIFHVPHPMKV